MILQLALSLAASCLLVGLVLAVAAGMMKVADVFDARRRRVAVVMVTPSLPRALAVATAYRRRRAAIDFGKPTTRTKT